MDTDGLLLEELEGSEVEEGEERQTSDCSEKQVICISFALVCNSVRHLTIFVFITWFNQSYNWHATIIIVPRSWCNWNCVYGDLQQDGWSSLNEVTLKDMASDEQYDPDTVYGEWRLTINHLNLLFSCMYLLFGFAGYSRAEFIRAFLFSAGSSFFVPVAGFICRLCNKFYHFESSALHTHCKSLKHFENLKVGFWRPHFVSTSK